LGDLRLRSDSLPVSPLNVLASRFRVFEMFVASGDEHDANHEAQQQKRDIGKAGPIGVS
jgi:hypothetical protein